MAGKASKKRPTGYNPPKAAAPTRAAPLPVLQWWESIEFHAFLLFAAGLAVYSNNFRHAYFLDDSHTIQNNLNIRSLANIPRFFVDPATFTSLRANVDYRPVLQTTYAINYWMGGY